jgi:hypothetical protein
LRDLNNMGILRYFGFMLQRYIPPDLTFFPGNIDCLWFDMNGIIHEVRERTIFDHPLLTGKDLEKMIFKNIIFRLESIVFRVSKENNNGQQLNWLIIAIDGIPPVAKMVKQRQGRFNSAIPKASTAQEAASVLAAAEEEKRAAVKKASKTEKKTGSNEINPGTDFMIRLNKYLREYLKSPNGQKLYRNLIYSSMSVVGEAEHKIMDLLKQEPFLNLRHIIHGLDADLLHLTSLSPAEQIYLLRDNPVRPSHEPRDPNKPIPTDTWFYYSIPEVRKWVRHRMGNTAYAIQDYFFITLLMGNDFFPPQAALLDVYSSGDLLIETYKEVQPCQLVKTETRDVAKRTATGATESIVTIKILDAEIDLENWRKFANKLKEKEAEWLYREGIRTETGARRGPKNQFRVYGRHPAFDVFKDTTTNLATQIQAFRYLYYSSEFSRVGSTSQTTEEASFTDISIKEMTFAYLQQLLWCFRYYNQGLAYTNFELAYQYYYSPLLSDIADMLMVVGSVTNPRILSGMPDPVKGILSALPDRCNLSAHREISPINLLTCHQMMLVLPYNSRKIVPTLLRPLMSCSLKGGRKKKEEPKESSYLSPIFDNYPAFAPQREYLILEREDDLGHSVFSILPDLPYERVVAAVDAVIDNMPDEKRPRFIAKYSPGVNLVITESEELRESRDILAGKLARSKGRMERGRGRGRGEGNRGRGESNRRRGEGTRGRGDGTRGRGDGTRGRGRGSDRGRGASLGQGALPVLM